MRFLGNFCFIPKNILIERGILNSTNNIGKKTMSICSPDYSKDHWSKQYWYPNNSVYIQKCTELILK